MNKTHICVVVPVYGCSKGLSTLCQRVKNTLEKITKDYEIILINDASPDSAWLNILKLASEDKRIKGINLSRNFGQHHAITAGINYADSDWLVVMDCDLQDKPEEIIKFYEKAQEGYDVVLGRRVERNDSFFKKTSSKLFYKIFDHFTDQKSDSAVANFGIYSKKVITNFKKFSEQNRTFPYFIKWMGFDTASIDVEHGVRDEGKSSYSLSRLVKFGLDNILAHSNKPLKYSVIFGFLLSFFSFLYGFWLIYRYMFFGIAVAGWTSTMVSIYFVGGLVFANLGVLGLYIGKIYDETKRRPIFIVKETCNIERESI